MNRWVARLLHAAMLCVIGLAHGAEVDPEPGFTARIIAVLDGDTVLIRRDGDLIKIRLADIDAPEHAQAFGEASKQSLSGMVQGKQVNVVSRAIDQYGRMVAYLSIDGMDVNNEQIKRGMAWEYSSFHRNHALRSMQSEARSSRLGLWSQGKPIAPWIWRKQHTGVIPARQGHPLSSVDGGESSVSDVLVCGQKKHCSEMATCEEARYYLSQCNVVSLDANGDGVPCESLCAPGNN